MKNPSGSFHGAKEILIFKHHLSRSTWSFFFLRLYTLPQVLPSYLLYQVAKTSIANRKTARPLIAWKAKCYLKTDWAVVRVSLRLQQVWFGCRRCFVCDDRLRASFSAATVPVWRKVTNLRCALKVWVRLAVQLLSLPSPGVRQQHQPSLSNNTVAKWRKSNSSQFWHLFPFNYTSSDLSVTATCRDVATSTGGCFITYKGAKRPSQQKFI